MGLSLLPPQGEGWITARLNDTQAAFVKDGTAPGSTYVVQATLFKLPRIDSRQKFLDHVIEMKTGQQGEDRDKRGQKTYEILVVQSAYCVRHHEIGEAKRTRDPSGKRPMILEVIGNTCQHPEDNTIGVDYGYSYIYPAGKGDPELREKAGGFLDGVRFTGF